MVKASAMFLIYHGELKILAKGENITRNKRHAKRDSSLDITNCLAIVHHLDYYADINTRKNLRRMIMHLPANLVEKWKSVLADLERKVKLGACTISGNL